MEKSINENIINLVPQSDREQARRILGVVECVDIDPVAKLERLYGWLQGRQLHAELRKAVGIYLYGSDRHAAN